MLLLCTLGWAACEEPLEIGDELAPQLRIEAQLQAGQSARVVVSAINALGEVLPSEAVESSFVSLSNRSSGTAQLQLVSSAEGEVVFEAPSAQRVISSESYRLLIDAPGFAELRSRTTVPAPVSIGLPSSPIKASAATSTSAARFDVPFRVMDVSNGADFYHLLLHVREADESIEEAKNLEYAFTALPAESLDANQEGYLFSDRSFNSSALEGFLQFDGNAVNTFSNPVVELEIRSVSTSYYEFYRQRTEQASGRIDGTGSGVAENISNGAGYFGSYTSTVSQIALSF